MNGPPPPPPHGEAPKSTGGSGLPPGKYDIFIIPEHSAGGGFLYLPSLRPNINSFVAGFASALALVVIGHSMAPAFQTWWANFQGMGNMGMMMLVIAVGLGAWSLGRTQQDGGGPGPSSGHGGGAGGAGFGGGASSHAHSGPPPHSQQQQQQQQPPPPPPPPPPQPDPPPQSEKPKSSWQQQQQRPPPQPGTARPETPRGTWEKAKEEAKRKEEERRAQEAERIRKEAAAQRLRELREKEARERALREERERQEKLERLEREAREREERERREREREHERERDRQRERERELKEQREREQRARELRERLEREKAERERAEKEKAEKEKAEKEKAERERLKREEDERLTRKGSTYAYSGVGERTNPWPNGKPPAAAAASSHHPTSSPSATAARSAAPPPPPPPPHSHAAPPHHHHPPPPPAPASSTSSPSTPTKKPPAPTAKPYVGPEEESTYSFRPYDKPKRTGPQPARKKSVSDLSEHSWAPSHSTARTTPPPSVRLPYATKDPDKIVIRAVYGFLNQFAKTPSSQLISGTGSVTDGLILRITTEGLFIDDDVRGVAQREWDVKAWTLKLVEVWCPVHFANPPGASSGGGGNNNIKPSGANINNASFLHKTSWRSSHHVRGDPKPLTDANADAYLAELLSTCKGTCRLGLCDSASATASAPAYTSPSAATASTTSSSSSTNRSAASAPPQTGEWKTKGLHLLRATVRDQEGKRYLFVLSEEEAWKVAVGLQRLRKGTQVRSLGVAGMSGLEVKSILELLGWGAI